MNKNGLFAVMTSKDAEFSWPPAKAVYVTSGQVVVYIADCNPTGNCFVEGGHSGCESRACTEAVGGVAKPTM